MSDSLPIADSEASPDDGNLIEQAGGRGLTPRGSFLVVEGKNQEHNPEAFRLL